MGLGFGEVYQKQALLLFDNLQLEQLGSAAVILRATGTLIYEKSF